ncbi:MAG: hypothetical protein J6F31_07330 [Oscillospiraceae bacterium]|nr:hypothetical protein [Oscillospiraceae bacterium]
MAESRIKRIFKGLGWWLAGEFITVIFTLCMVFAMRRFMLVRIFVGLASVFIVNALYFNFAHNCAKADKNAVNYHKAERKPYESVTIAMWAPLFQYISWIVLLLSKLGAVRDIFNYYILSNIQCIAWVDLFTEGRTIDHLSPAGLMGLLAIVLIAPITIIITYECTFRELDIKSLLMYDRKEK